MGLTKIAIERPITVLMVVMALMIFGVSSYTALSIDRLPESNVPFVTIVVAYPGASPADVETEVVKPIEDAMAAVAGLDSMESTSLESVGVVMAAFTTNVDGDQAAIDITRSLELVDLPADAEEPLIVKADPNSMPIMNIAVSGTQSLEEKYRIADEVIKPQLLSTEGVAAVTISGGLEREIQVQIDPLRMAGYNLSLTQLGGVLMQENVDVPLGFVTTSAQRTAVRSLGRFSSTEDIENLILSYDGNRIYLKDVADVKETHKEVEEKLRLNGTETVSLSITKQSDANVVRTSESIRDAIEDLNVSLPDGVSLEIINDSAEYTKSAVNAVVSDLVLAVLITGAVMLFFLHMWRSTLVVLLAVPISLISTFLVMYALGFTLNNLSLMALALVIGVLVDDSVVILENIVHHLGLGESPKQAALNGRAEIGMAAIVITLCDIVIYLPIAFMSGLIGRFFKEYGITIATAVLFSLAVSFTVTPMLASMWLTGERKSSGLWGKFVDAWEKAYDGLAYLYGRLLGWSLSHGPVVLFIAVLCFAGALAMIPLGFLPSELMPPEDTGQVLIDLKMPGRADLETTDKAARKAEEIAMAIPETKSVLTQVGSKSSNVFSQLGSSGAQLTINLLERDERSRSSLDVLTELQEKVVDIPNANILVSLPNSWVQGMMSSDLEVVLAGPDLDVLVALANQTELVMTGMPEIATVRNMQTEPSPERHMMLDRDRMHDLGVSSAEVGQVLRAALSGAQVSTYRAEGESEQDITLIANSKTRDDLDELERVPLTYAGNGAPVRASQVARMSDSQVPSEINRYNRERTITISGSLAKGAALGDVYAAVVEGVERTAPLPAGYHFVETGLVKLMGEAFGSLTRALLLSIILLYMLMAALYESFVSPLSIMFSLPLSLIGAFLGLVLTGSTLNVFSLLGLVMLMGLVTKNGILIVDLTNSLRKEGIPRAEALIRAGRQRMRPILMTSAAIVFAMMPLVLRSEAGSETRAPLAIVIIGGVTTSTLLSLVVIPTVYTYFDELETFVRCRIRHQSPRFVQKQVAPADEHDLAVQHG